MSDFSIPAILNNQNKSFEDSVGILKEFNSNTIKNKIESFFKKNGYTLSNREKKGIFGKLKGSWEELGDKKKKAAKIGFFVAGTGVVGGISYLAFLFLL